MNRTPRIDWPSYGFFNPLFPNIMVQDIDEVLCEDSDIVEVDGDQRYVDSIVSAKPLFPVSFRVANLVTCRLEKYRGQTEKWLADNGIAYDRLYMMNYNTPEERRRHKKHAEYKAGIYVKTGAVLFVESSEAQAVKIRRLSGKPVFCVETMEML